VLNGLLGRFGRDEGQQASSLRSRPLRDNFHLADSGLNVLIFMQGATSCVERSRIMSSGIRINQMIWQSGSNVSFVVVEITSKLVTNIGAASSHLENVHPASLLLSFIDHAVMWQEADRAPSKSRPWFGRVKTPGRLMNTPLLHL
jgi:hypothetical protein